MIFYATLQALWLDQFTRVIPDLGVGPIDRPAVIGTIGNASHFSAYLGMCMPLFFGKKLFNILSIILIWVILLFYTDFGMNCEPVALSGIVIGLAVTGYYLFKTNTKHFLIFCGICLIVFVVGLFLKYGKILSPGGRLAYWQYYMGLAKETFITGKGLGSVNLIAKQHATLNRVRHLHNEYFQYLFEIGLVGLLAILYGIYDYFKVKVKEDKTALVVKSVFLGFLINCMFLFPTHIWVSAMVGVFAYASLYAIKNGELNYDSYAKGTEG